MREGCDDSHNAAMHNFIAILMNFNMIASLIEYQSVITRESLSGSHKVVSISSNKVSNKVRKLPFRACPYTKVQVSLG